ncbi:hypothetical protein B566_EDAN011302 [Ephemera danica]|nr:hypothetical protein B566_EDAN011302 [Ephemera danica]
MSDAEDCSWDGYVDRLHGARHGGVTLEEDEEEEVWASPHDELAPRLPHQVPREFEKDDEDWLLCGDNFLEPQIVAAVKKESKLRRLLKLGLKADEAPPGRLSAAGSASDVSPDSGIAELAHLTPEEQEAQRREWQEELAKVEDEIATFRHVLASKTRQAHELKRKLGISVWREFQDDLGQGIRNVKESNVFQKTESVLKTTAEKTTSILGGFGVGLTTKIGQLKNSDSFRSFEEKVGSAYENVKTKVSSRSNSVTSFDDALREAEGRRTSNGTPVTSPTIPEERPLS